MKLQIVFLIAFIGTIRTSDELNSALVGQNGEVLEDEITDLTGGEGLIPGATKMRHVLQRYAYATGEHPHIYYDIYQVLDDDHNVLREDAKFSWERTGEFHHLPAGCPPPILQAPEKPDPCSMGYKIGEEVATVIANVVVPQLLDDDGNNPYSSEPLFQ